MSKPIIEVNNLSKSYIISHEGKERYTALRDVMAQKAKKIFSFPKPLSVSGSATKEEFWALKDVSFKIEQGDRVGIIGRNGAGKSTLLKILSRITEPTAGEIKIKGRVASLLEVGTGFHPELTGRENIFLNGAILGMSRAEIRKHFDAIVDFAEVERFLDTPVKRYSSGMYVRLAFAVAAHLEPEILVVDEVLAVGDAQFQKKCLGKMEDVSKNEGRTVLFVSHNIIAIRALCKNGIFLANGKIDCTDNIQNVIEKYFESSFKLNSTGVIPDNVSRFNTGEAKFRKITLVNSSNDFTCDFFLMERLTIMLGLEVFQQIKDVLVDLKICTLDGIVIVHTMNVFNGGGLFSFDKGEHEIKIEMENNLQPGNYSISIGIHYAKYGTPTIDFLENIYNLSVSNIDKNNDPVSELFHFAHGYIRPEAKWSV